MRLLLLAALLLASCDGQPDQAGKPPIVFSDRNTYPGLSIAPSNEYSRQIFDMGGQLRRATFRNLFYHSGMRCDLVSEALLRGGRKKTDFWRVTCTDSGGWMVSIAPDSSTKILHCATAKKLGDDCATPL